MAKFMVIEFDRNDKRIVLSHSRLWEQVIEEEKQAIIKEKKADAEADAEAKADECSLRFHNVTPEKNKRIG